MLWEGREADIGGGSSKFAVRPRNRGDAGRGCAPEGVPQRWVAHQAAAGPPANSARTHAAYVSGAVLTQSTQNRPVTDLRFLRDQGSRW